MSAPTMAPPRGGVEAGDFYALLGAGVVGGIIAGTAMMLWSLIVAGVNGLGFWLPAKLIAGTFMGVNVIVYGVGTVIFGLFLHYAMATFWALLFALLMPRAAPLLVSVAIGVAYGVAVWAFMRYPILPWLDPTFFARVQVVWWSFFVAHLIYGAFLGFVPFLRRAFHAPRSSARPLAI